MVCAVGADGEVRTAGGMSKMQVYPMFNVRFQQSFTSINAFSVLTFKVLGGTQWYFICSTTALFFFFFC